MLPNLRKHNIIGQKIPIIKPGLKMNFTKKCTLSLYCYKSGAVAPIYKNT